MLSIQTTTLFSFGIIMDIQSFSQFLHRSGQFFCSTRCSPRAYNCYLDKGYKPIQVYSCKYFILSCFQLHEYVDNGYYFFLSWIQNKFLLRERKIVQFFFNFQNRFFPRIPDDGLIVDSFSLLTWTTTTAILLFLDFMVRAYYVCHEFFINLKKSFLWKIHSLRNLTHFCWILSPFSKVIPTATLYFGYEAFLSDQDCIKRCYDSEQRQAAPLLNFMNEKCESVYVDNCANCHISNDKSHFISYTKYSPEQISASVNTIGGDTMPEGEGNFRWRWRDDNGNLHKYDLPGCKYYPSSPVCILSQTQLGLFLEDTDFGTKIESGIRTSVLYWENQKYTRTIAHTASFMP